MNNDGELDSFERAMDFMAFEEVIDEEENDEENDEDDFDDETW